MSEAVQEAATETPESVFPRVRDTFYIAACQKLNGALDIESDAPEPLTLEAAIKKASENVHEYGEPWFVIECRAVRKVIDRKPSVQKIR